MKRLRQSVLMLVVLAVSGVSPAMAGSDDFRGTYTFTVFRNGDPVGLHTFHFDHVGDQIRIEARSEFEVKLAFIPVYTFSHHHRELWQNGAFVLSEGVTDKNGEKVEVSLEAKDGGLQRTVNGRSERLSDVTPLTIWNPKILDDSRFVSIAEDKVIEAPFEYLGSEALEIAGQEMSTEHFAIRGNEQREVWYDPAGHVAKVRLERGDSVLEYIRNEPTLELPKQLACSTVPPLSC